MSLHLIESWRDIVEILFFSAIFYQVTLWLKKDHTKNLLPAFYGFMLFAYGVHLLHLPSISYILLVSWPIVIMFFILIHQKTLQRNFIALKNIPAQTLPPENWIELMVAHCLNSLNNNVPLCCIVEHTDSVDLFLQSPLMINAPIQKELLELITTSSSFNPDAMILINSQGMLRGINCSWRTSLHDQQDIEHWKHDTLLHTSNTDTLAFFTDSATHTITIIAKGSITQHVNAHYLLQVLNQKYGLATKNNTQAYSQTNNKKNNIQKTGESHDKSPHETKKSTHNQLTP